MTTRVPLLLTVLLGFVVANPGRPETLPTEGPTIVAALDPNSEGAFRATSLFEDRTKGTGTCVTSATTLCIDDAPDDRRFEVTVDFDTSLNGGTSGQGKAIPLSSLGIRRGGLFWFFDPTNPELLIKILNGCSINGNYWIFWSAGTTVGLELTVNDTVTGRTKVYLDPDGSTALPITDTGAFSCP